MDKYLLMREVINLAYIHTDAKKKGEASLAATTLLAATGNPALIKAGEEAILAAWAYTESICEARSLLAGKKVPALKTAACWHTKMTDILHPGSSGYLDSASGLSYEDYLLAILMMENDADKNIRFMDLIERSIRKEKGYENFKMENCITGFSLQGSFVAHKLFASIGDKKLSYEGDISYEKLERN